MIIVSESDIDIQPGKTPVSRINQAFCRDEYSLVVLGFCAGYNKPWPIGVCFSLCTTSASDLEHSDQSRDARYSSRYVTELMTTLSPLVTNLIEGT